MFQALSTLATGFYPREFRKMAQNFGSQKIAAMICMFPRSPCARDLVNDQKYVVELRGGTFNGKGAFLM